MSRRILINTESVAREMRETFTKKPVHERIEFPWGWPRVMQHVGENVGVAYASDKWKKDGDFQLYKHIAESPNRVLAVPGFLHDFRDQGRRWPVTGPMVNFSDVPKGKHFAFLAHFEEIDIKMHNAGEDLRPRFAKPHLYVKVTLKHGLLGGAVIPWRSVDPGARSQTMLFIYTEADGIKMIVEGDELEVAADGIAG